MLRLALLHAGALALVLSLSACEGVVFEDNSNKNVSRGGKYYEDLEKERANVITGDGGLLGSLFGGNGRKGESEGGGIGVNAYLWRASLDTLSFAPLSSADPFGGVIITDWYAPPETPSERFKLTVLILGKQLRADGVRVSVFRESRSSAGTWESSSVKPKTATALENKILERARELRFAVGYSKN